MIASVRIFERFETAAVCHIGVARLVTALRRRPICGTDLPRLPVSGPEEKPLEIATKPSRGDFTTLPDSGIDKFSAQLTYRSCVEHPKGEEEETWSSSLGQGQGAGIQPPARNVIPLSTRVSPSDPSTLPLRPWPS